MDINRIKSTLQFAIPDELYNIEPGQIAYFVPLEGLSQRNTRRLTDFFVYLRRLYEDNNVNLSIIPTRNELLIDTFAGRTPQEVGNPYKIVVSTWETLAGFASEYFGENIESIVERVPNMGIANPRISVSTTNLPAVITISPKTKRVKKQPIIVDNSCDSPLEVLTAKPEPGSKEEKKLSKKEEDKLYSLLRECYVFDIKLDIDKIKKKFDKAINSNIDYQLVIKTKFHSESYRTFCLGCDFYVAEGKMLNLTAVEKAIYLTFLLYGKKGIRVKDAFWGFRETCMKIYGRLPFEERNEKDDGFRNDKFATPEVYASTLRGYLSTIRKKVSRLVSNPKTAIEFAIEGYKDQEFAIARSTPELIAQIKREFKLYK